MSAAQKRLSPKYFYDERGSELFDRICELPEYYATRTELASMRRARRRRSRSSWGRAPPSSSSARAQRRRFARCSDHLVDPVAYIPVDISADFLAEARRTDLARDYPNLVVRPVVADFTQPFRLPDHRLKSNRNFVFFPGSMIGNFSRRQALDLLEVMAFEAKHDGALLIGVDLRKHPERLQAAYNDSAGVTAEFNKNVLVRLNRELGADFSVQNFRHRAVYDDDEGRVEMRLVSTKPQSVHVAGRTLDFAKDEYIVTEHSHKYSVDEFRDLARRAGFEPVVTWVDDEELFSVHYLKVQ